jgi:hypothetical protein
MSATPVVAGFRVGAETHQRNYASPRPRLSLVLVAGAAGLLAAACGGSAADGGMSATIDGKSWHSPGQGYIVTGSDGTTSFDLFGSTPLPNSSLIDSSKPQLLIVFPQGVPSPGTYSIDGVTVNVEYLLNPSTFYDGSNGSVQVTSMSPSRAQGMFSFELQSPFNDPKMLTVTDGAFDVPVSAH